MIDGEARREGTVGGRDALVLRYSRMPPLRGTRTNARRVHGGEEEELPLE